MFWHQKVWLLQSVVLLQNYFGYLGSLKIPYEFQDEFFCFFKKCHWNFDRDCIESVDCFGYGRLNNIKSSNHEHGFLSICVCVHACVWIYPYTYIYIHIGVCTRAQYFVYNSCFNHSTFVISGFASCNWFFSSLWIVFSFFFECLLSFVWMPDIVNFVVWSCLFFVFL